MRPAEIRSSALEPGQPTKLPSPPYGPVLAYGARAASKESTIVFLHGMCDTPENECAYLHEAATGFGDLVCPRANGRCSNGNAIWQGSFAQRRAPVDAALVALEERRGPFAKPTGPTVLIGFSQGAYEAVNLVTREEGPYTHLVLIGANVEPDARTLQRHGIRAVILASGDFDGAMPTMRRSASVLARAGMRAKFESLGKVGHSFAPNMREWTEQALAWLLAGDKAD